VGAEVGAGPPEPVSVPAVPPGAGLLLASAPPVAGGAPVPPPPDVAFPEGALSEGAPVPCDGVHEGEGEISGFEGDLVRPVRTSPTVVLEPPLKLLPDTSSYVVIPAMATPKTTAAATTGRLHPLTRARWTVASVNSPMGTAFCSSRGLACTATSRICSPVRLKTCWKTEPPQVATTLITPAPRIVP